ncbi:hypothetical protein MAR_022553 [Mya arenaria]|uniref:Uncharacterized protein n=1 Tax=Mya arenaria TaxID=6604 RepID=A0ABY7DTA0_MYAAR|nr:hypothetical protein MAR_022553 [Mya arenaria]
MENVQLTLRQKKKQALIEDTTLPFNMKVYMYYFTIKDNSIGINKGHIQGHAIQRFAYEIPVDAFSYTHNCSHYITNSSSNLIEKE